MAIAGKVAPTFKGDYDATVTYQFYDVVRHNNSLWMSKKSNTLGIEPTTENAEYWFLAIDGSFTDASTLDGHDSEYFATAQSVTDITNGTTQVGDSAKLGGKGASEYALDTDLAKYLPKTNTSKPTVSTANNDVITFNNNMSNGTHAWLNLHLKGEEIGAFGFNQNKKPQVWVNSTAKEILHAGNYDDYALSLSGGTLSGDVIIQKADDWGRFRIVRDDCGRTLSWQMTSDDRNNRVSLFANTLTGNAATLHGIVIRPETENLADAIALRRGVDGSTNYYNILHTGNKPTGTYTGNGSATERNINIGGIGGIVYLYNRGTGEGALAYGNGVLVFRGSEVTHLTSSTGYFWEGTLKIKSSNGTINGSGNTIDYWLL